MKQDKSLLMMVVPAGLFLLAALTGCARTVETHPVQTQIHIPEDKFQCLPNGTRPTGTPIMESDVARYITNLEESNTDCRTRLQEIRVLIQCYNDPACDENTLMNYMTLARQHPTG